MISGANVATARRNRILGLVANVISCIRQVCLGPEVIGENAAVLIVPVLGFKHPAYRVEEFVTVGACHAVRYWCRHTERVEVRIEAREAMRRVFYY